MCYFCWTKPDTQEEAWLVVTRRIKLFCKLSLLSIGKRQTRTRNEPENEGLIWNWKVMIRIYQSTRRLWSCQLQQVELAKNVLWISTFGNELNNCDRQSSILTRIVGDGGRSCLFLIFFLRFSGCLERNASLSKSCWKMEVQPAAGLPIYPFCLSMWFHVHSFPELILIEINSTLVHACVSAGCIWIRNIYVVFISRNVRSTADVLHLEKPPKDCSLIAARSINYQFSVWMKNLP